MKFYNLILCYWMPVVANSLNCVKIDTKDLDILQLIQLMEFKQPTLMNPSKGRLISQIKQFAKADMNTASMLNFEDLKQERELIITSKITLTEPFNKIKKALIVFEDYNTTFGSCCNFTIDQQVYFYKTTSCELFESYAINGRKISRKLGNFDKNKFLWNSNVDQRY